MTQIESQIGRYRVPTATKRLLNKLRGISEVRPACEMIIDLLENYYRYEVAEANAFDPKTGKPVGYVWRPGVEFEYEGRFGNIYLGGANCIDPGEEDIRLHPTVERSLVSSPTLIACNISKYAFIYSERGDSGSEQGGGSYYATRRQIDIYHLKEK